MNIYLGNLSIEEIESRAGVSFPEELKKYMDTRRQESASNIKNGKWHCFDIPFNLVCGDMETATKIFNSVKDRSNECKEQLQFSLSSIK